MTIIEEKQVAAMVHTPGPWEWMTTHNGSVYLGTPNRGRLVVMDFVRLGVNTVPPRLAPRFAVWPGKDRLKLGGIMVPADEKLLGIHPDAWLIAAAPDHALLLRAMLAGAARCEKLGDGVEICVNGLRHFVTLDPAGCPRLHDGVRSELTKAIIDRLLV